MPVAWQFTGECHHPLRGLRGPLTQNVHHLHPPHAVPFTATTACDVSIQHQGLHATIVTVVNAQPAQRGHLLHSAALPVSVDFGESKTLCATSASHLD